MNYETIAVAAGGWLLALAQFIYAKRASHVEEEAKFLERTLGYFERGTQARSIALSLVEWTWLDRPRHLKVIVPVLVSQLVFLLRDAKDYGQEGRNLIRLLNLIHKAVPFAADPHYERCEILDALLVAGNQRGQVLVSKTTLRLWFERFGGDLEQFDCEAGVHEDHPGNTSSPRSSNG